MIDGVNVERRGSGPPLLLVHGIGHRWQMWTPLLDALADAHDVVALDLPGFGLSRRLPDDVAPDVGSLADAVERVLDELGWDAPHLVGNSLGGWLGFELARRGRARSVCALCPAGLATSPARRRIRRMLFATWVGSVRRAPALVTWLRFAPVRSVALFGLFARPWKVPAEIAIGDARNLATCDFDRTFDAVCDDVFAGGIPESVPVTVVYAALDPLVRPGPRALEVLPASAETERLRWCGHVPTWDDPSACLHSIRRTVARVPTG